MPVVGAWSAYSLPCASGLALSVLNYFEDFIPKLHYRTVTLRTPWHVGCISEIVARFEQAGFKVSDASFERIGDLTHAEVRLQIAFKRKKQYYEFAHQLEGDEKVQLIGTSDS